jgi:hypothetical protein
LLHKNNNNFNNKSGQLLNVLRLHISVAQQQKTKNFKVVIASTVVQWSALTEEKERNQRAQTEFRLTQTTIIIRAAAVTIRSSPAHQRCSQAKDGKPQGGLLKQTNAVEWPN